MDGEEDPWREASPHAVGREGRGGRGETRNRTSSTQEPFLLIEGAVHHWDENGVFGNETREGVPPGPVAEVQREEVRFVREWLEEFRVEKRGGEG